MLVTPSFDEVQEEVVPGTYKVTIKKGTPGEYSTGTPYVNWELETWGEADPKNNGRRIFHRTPTAGKGAFQIQRFYRAAAGEILSGAFDTEQLVGKQVEVEVGEREYEGKKYTEVKSVRAVSAN